MRFTGFSFRHIREMNSYFNGSNTTSPTKNFIFSKGDRIMLAAKAGFSILEKIAPKAVAALGKAGVAEVALVAGAVAEGLDIVMTPVVNKGCAFVKSKVKAATENKKQALLDKRAAILEQKALEAKAEAAAVQETEEEEVAVEKPKTSNKKKNK